MIKKIILVTLFIFLHKSATAQNTFPSFTEIVNSFFSTYDLRTDQDADDIQFVKRKEGYFIQEYDYEKESFRMERLFWSANKGTYTDLSFPDNNKPDDDHIEFHLSYYNVDLFNRLPYYGYVTWPKDVILYLTTKATLTNTEQYALGRAYSMRASHLLNESSAFSDPDELFTLNESGKNQLSTNQLKTYKEYVLKAIESYSLLYKKNPKYPTIVGTIRNKLDNEYASAFLNLLIYQNENEAMSFLPDNLYSNLFLDSAKNYLNSLEKNAILFTTGDNDTYPLLYAQAKLKYRRDVRIVNTSLLNQESYVNHLRDDKLFDSKPVQMTLLHKTYAKEKLDLVVLTSDDIPEDYSNLTTLFNLINTNNPVIHHKEYPEYNNFPSNKLAIPTKNGPSFKLNYDSSYIIQGEVIALDIIASNFEQRPIYCAYNELPIISKYLELTGMAYKLVLAPQNKVEDSKYMGGINADKTFSVLVDNLEIHKYTERKLSILIGYALNFDILARHYQTIGENKKCEAVLTKFINSYPKNSYQETSYLISDIAETAYKVDLPKIGDDIIIVLLNKLEQKKGFTKPKEPTVVEILKSTIFGETKSNKGNENLEKQYSLLLNLKDLNINNVAIQKRIDDLEKFYIYEYEKL